MKTLRTMASAVCTAGLLLLSSTAGAGPISFSITGAAFTNIGVGYGQDGSEPGTLLDVRFSTSGFITQNFVLSGVGASTSPFNFGTISMFEPNNAGGIDAAEMDFLGVSARFTFVTPVGTPQTVAATGTATAGSFGDPAADLVIHWTPILVAFGSGGEFRIDMADTSLTDNGGQTVTQKATITLTKEGGTPLPEPSTVALLGLGLLGAAFSRRKSGGGSA